MDSMDSNTKLGSDVLIHRVSACTSAAISAAQIVLNMSAAVNELLENALDAGATQIGYTLAITLFVVFWALLILYVQLRNHGVDSLQVSDNGHGIEEHNFPNICKAHHTSKLSSFESIALVNTFGFRGEALSSLAALGKVEIVTRAQDAVLGTRITFKADGSVEQQTSTARQPGTTVIVRDLFHLLPVRRQELLRNAKREFSKVVCGLQAYALACTNLRLRCSHLLQDGSNVSVLASAGSVNMRDNISNVFGAKLLEHLLALPPTVSINELIAQQYSLDHEQLQQAQNYVLAGYGCFLDFKMKITFDLLILGFAVVGSTVRLSGYVSSITHGCGRSNTDRQFVFFNGRPCDFPKLHKVANQLYRQYNRAQYPCLLLCVNVPSHVLDRNVSPDKRRVFVKDEKLLCALLHATLTELYDAQQPLCNQTFTHTVNHTHNTSLSSVQSYSGTPAKQLKLQQFQFSSVENKKSEVVCRPPANVSLVQPNEHNENQNISTTISNLILHKVTHSDVIRLPAALLTDEQTEPDCCDNLQGKTRNVNSTIQKEPEQSCAVVAEPSSTGVDLLPEEYIEDITEDPSHVPTLDERTVCTLSICIEQITDKAKAFTHRRTSDQAKQQTQTGSDNADTDTDTGLLSASQNELAEAQLDRYVTKHDFTQMSVIGQFNKGFIVCRLRDELFIVDQHAADEKYMFETYQRNALIQSQRMIRPQALELTATNEAVVKDNLAIFQKNGFDFEFNPEGSIGSRVLLTSAPCLNGWVFDTNDVDDMITYLSEFPGVMYRPMRLRKIFASKACRKSVMIGRALQTSEMCRIVRHLCSLDHPWNCPHGRPTIRHLSSVQVLNRIHTTSGDGPEKDQRGQT